MADKITTREQVLEHMQHHAVLYLAANKSQTGLTGRLILGEGREEIKVPDSIVKAMIQDKVGTAIVNKHFREGVAE